MFVQKATGGGLRCQTPSTVHSSAHHFGLYVGVVLLTHGPDQD